MFSTKSITKIVIGLTLFSSHCLAHGHGGAEDPNEIQKPDSSMVSLPIHIGLDGSVSWGLEMNHGDMNHGDMNHGDMNHGDMNHGDMNHGDMNHGDMNHGDMNHGDMNHGDMNHGDMDHGDMDHGDMDHGDMNNNDMNDDMNDDMSDEMAHSDSSWMFGVMPMLHLGYDRYKRVINLSETKNSELEMNDSSKGFLVVENKAMEYGAGLMIMAMPPGDIPFGAYLHTGLMPYKGGHTFKAKKVNNTSAYSLDLSQMVTPLSSSELDNWSVNDRLSYSTTGGVMFSAGIGVQVFADLSIGYMAQGTWVTSISKASKKHALVSIRKSKMKMFMSSVGITVASLQLHQFNNADKNFNFLFDLSKPHALKAYKDMIQGNIVTAQMMDESRQENSGVRNVSLGTSTSTGRMKMRSFGLPILFKKKSMYGQMNTASYTENYMNNTQMKMEMGMYMRSASESGIWSAHKDTGFIFMAGSHKMTGQFSGSSDSVMGSFKWYFQNDRGTINYLKARFNRAMNIMGVDSLKKINTENLIGHGPLNFVRGEIDLALTDKFSRKLMSLSSHSDLYTRLYQAAYKEMNKYFSSYANLVKMCPRKLTRIVCKKKIYRRSWSAISNIPKVLARMSKNYRVKNEKEFVKAYTSLGQLMLTNRFVFQEVFRATGEEMPKASLSLQGSKFSKMTMKL